MKKIQNKFSIIGTNPNAYLNNYLLYFCQVGKGDVIYINKNDYSLIHNEIVLIRFNSDTTFKQNLNCWIGLGLFIKKDNKLIKCLGNKSEYDLYEYIKLMLLVSSNDNNINIYRDSILIKLFNLMGLEVIEKLHLNSRKKTISLKDIEKETGIFENKIIKDEAFKKILQIIWGDNNE